jgi:hypothetical protein
MPCGKKDPAVEEPSDRCRQRGLGAGDSQGSLTWGFSTAPQPDLSALATTRRLEIELAGQIHPLKAYPPAEEMGAMPDLPWQRCTEKTIQPTLSTPERIKRGRSDALQQTSSLSCPAIFTILFHLGVCAAESARNFRVAAPVLQVITIYTPQ